MIGACLDRLDPRSGSPVPAALLAAAAGGMVMRFIIRTALSKPCTCCMISHMVRLEGGGFVCPICDLTGDPTRIRSLDRFDVYFRGQEFGSFRGGEG